MGENIGEDVLYSGTVGAAREGAIHRISSIACSTSGPEFHHLESAAKVVIDLVDRLEKKKSLLVNPFLWNVNIPNKLYSQIAGYKTTKLGLRPLHQPLIEQTTPRGNTIYWQGQSSDPEKAEMGTDIEAFLEQNMVSITPLGMLPTDFNQMPIIAAVTS